MRLGSCVLQMQQNILITEIIRKVRKKIRRILKTGIYLFIIIYKFYINIHVCVSMYMCIGKLGYKNFK